MPEKQKWPREFLLSMQTQLGDQYPAFLEALEHPPTTSLLVNKARLSDKTPFPGSPVPWCREGLLLSERPYFTHDPRLHAGAYYVMDASSMLIDVVLRQYFPSPDGRLVLDLCAAPGGKSALLSNYLGESNFLVSNEVIRSRFSILQENMIKWGNPSRLLCSMDPGRLEMLGPVFDCILVDAPCSGEGLFRKDPGAAQLWNPEMVQHCSFRQKRILESAVNLLRDSGLLIYTTCTFNATENIENCLLLANACGLQSLHCDFPPEWGISEQKKNGVFGYQLYPHLSGTEGFFLSVFRKGGVSEAPQFSPSKGPTKNRRIEKQYGAQWLKDIDLIFIHSGKGKIRAVPAIHSNFTKYLLENVRGAHAGIEILEKKGDFEIPSHELALSTLFNELFENQIVLSLDEALDFLRKQSIDRDVSEHGWYRATYNGHGLGWMKNGGQGWKNYYPMGWRIRK